MTKPNRGTLYGVKILRAQLNGEEIFVAEGYGAGVHPIRTSYIIAIRDREIETRNSIYGVDSWFGLPSGQSPYQMSKAKQKRMG